jgi:hypothetical protein
MNLLIFDVCAGLGALTLALVGNAVIAGLDALRELRKPPLAQDEARRAVAGVPAVVHQPR